MRYSKLLKQRSIADNNWTEKQRKRMEKVQLRKNKRRNKKIADSFSAMQIVRGVVKNIHRQAEIRTLKNRDVRYDYLTMKGMRHKSNPDLFDKELKRGASYIEETISPEGCIYNTEIEHKRGTTVYKGNGVGAFALLQLVNELKGTHLREEPHWKGTCQVGGRTKTNIEVKS